MVDLNSFLEDELVLKGWTSPTKTFHRPQDNIRVKTKNGHDHYTDLHGPYWLYIRLAFAGKDVDWRNPQAYFETDVKNMNFDT